MRLSNASQSDMSLLRWFVTDISIANAINILFHQLRNNLDRI